MTIPICVFGGDETKENIESNLSRYKAEIDGVRTTDTITVDGRIVPVSNFVVCSHTDNNLSGGIVLHS